MCVNLRSTFTYCINPIFDNLVKDKPCIMCHQIKHSETIKTPAPFFHNNDFQYEFIYIACFNLDM